MTRNASPRLHRRRAARAAAFVAVLAFTLASAQLPRRARAETPSGAVYVTTLPAAADVWIDGVYVGRSPVLIGALASGRHELTLTKAGWNVREVSVDARAGTTVMSSSALEAAPAREGATGIVEVRGLPAGAHAAIDGRSVEANAPLTLTAGPHELALAFAHGVKAVRAFTVVGETSSVLVVREPERETKSAVVGLADDYVRGAYTIENGKIVVRYGGHVAVAHLGDPVVRIDGSAAAYDAAPEKIGTKLYLPLDVLVRLTGTTTRETPVPAPPVKVRPTPVPPAPTPAPAATPTLTPSSAPASATPGESAGPSHATEY